jgi:cell shape-determining protein MreC
MNNICYIYFCKILKNLKFYFDKFEEEMSDMPKTEPTTPEYKAEKEKKQQEDESVETEE